MVDTTPRTTKPTGIPWIGEIPTHWQCERFKKFIISSNGGEVIDKSWWHDGDELLFTCQITPMKSSYTNFPQWKRTTGTDLLVTRNATPYVFQPPKGAIYSNVVQRIIFDSRQINRQFLTYALQQGAVAYGQASGISIPSYNMDIWRNIYLPLPPLSEQRQIATHLDELTGAIDESVRLIDEQISDLREYRKSVITEVVTHGVPRTHDNNSMQDSGIEWIGTIPQEWNTSRIGRHFQFVKEICGTRSCELPRLALTLNGVIQRSKTDSEGLQPLNFDTYQILRKNELVFKLIDLENTQTSRIGRSPFTTGMVSPAYIILRQSSGEILPEYAEYYFISLWLNHILNGLGSAGVRSNLNVGELLRVPIPLPCIDEQHKIITYLQSKTAMIESLASNLSAERHEFLAYRQSIINEYVTGKRLI